jgi:uncharacterized protein
MKTILITGGTGLVGTALSKFLSGKGYHIIILTRDASGKSNPEKNIDYATWNIEKQEIDIASLQKADYIIHLAGAGVFEKRWTDSYKKEIVDSRTKSSQFIFSCLKKYPNNVKAVVSASAIGWYGEDKEQHPTFIETDLADPSFLGDTCKRWEESISTVESLNKRLVKFRIGIILSNDGGAFIEFKRSLQFGVAAILGDGRQIISWIHIEDLCRLFLYAIEDEDLTGVFNAVAPNPITNSSFMLQLAKLVRGRFFIPVYIPSFLLKLLMGEKSIEVLKSTHVSCNKIKQTGFTFLFPTAESAIRNLIFKDKR